MNFSELNINDNIKKALSKKGFSKASEIQEKVIPAALSGKDVVGKSKTGTGKTAAFAIPLIEKMVKERGFSALVIVPTRELATQVKDEIASIAIGSHVKTAAVFGGHNINPQIRLLERSPEIIVGTPGRLLDLISRRALRLNNARFLILDEADKMFDMGFRKDVEKIIAFLPTERQTMLFSATMPEEILGLINKHLRHDKIVFDLSTDNASVQEVSQFYVMADKNQKIYSLHRLLKSDASKTLVFCRTKRTVNWLAGQLSMRGVRAMAIHGNKSQGARTKIIDDFKRFNNGILIATDIVARGIHVDDIGSVINFDFPEETETYLHRIGRTARQGKTGKAISFCSNVSELKCLEKIGRRNNMTLQEITR